jgi:hypothetical protein
MADNVILNLGTGGDTVAADDISGVKHQRAKIEYGADGSATDVSPITGLPIVSGAPTAATATWDSSTADETTLELDITGYGAVAVEFFKTGSITAGQIIFEISPDGTRFYSLGIMDSTGSEFVSFYNLTGGSSAWKGQVSGFVKFRVRLSTPITDTGTAAIRISAAAMPVADNVRVLGGSVGVAGNVGVDGIAAHDAPGTAYDPVLTGGYASIAAPASVSADGDSVRSWYLRNGAQAVVLTAAGALIGGDAANGADVDVTRLPALVAGSANIGDVDVLTLPALVAGSAKIGSVDLDSDATPASAVPATAQFVAGTDGTNAQGLKTDASGELQVDVLTMPTTVVTATDLDIRNLASGQDSVAAVAAGDIAHDSADSGNPVKVGGMARSSFPTAVANADRVNMTFDLFGRQMTSHIDPAMAVHKNKTYTGTQTGTDVWTPAGGKRIAITSVIIGTYGTTAGRIILWFGANADTTFSQDTDQVVVAASFAPSATSKPGLVFTPAFPIFCPTADFELHVTSDAGISFDLTVEGYEF